MSRGPPPLYRFIADQSGQSNTLAVVLLVGITLTGTAVVVTFGSTAVGETQAAADLGQAEQAMTQFDSRTSLVAHGSSEAQRVTVETNGQGGINLDENAGQMKVEIVNQSDGTPKEVVMNETMGTVAYERGGATIAYQGGGVWRGEDGGSVMVSPPEFHYRSGTLTLPLVTVTGQAASGGKMLVRQTGPSVGKFPNASSRQNPLKNGSVNVTVTSEYYRAWGRYFTERTAGNVTYDDPNNQVQIELVAPFEDEFGNVLETTQQGGITANPAGTRPNRTATGVNYPSADGRVEGKIDDCESGSCSSWTTDVNTDGTYYYDGDLNNEDLEVDTTDGDVELVVNGEVKNLKSLEITGDNNVTLYVRQDFSNNGDINTAPDSGNATQLRTIVHSDGTVSNDGNSLYVGLLYAPGSEVDFNGGGGPGVNIRGAVIGETADVNGDPNEFEYDEDLEGLGLGLGSNAPKIRYLHVSTTEVEVDD